MILLKGMPKELQSSWLTLDDDAKLKKVAEETKENLATKEQELQKEVNVEMQNHQSTTVTQEISQAEGKRWVQEQQISDAESELLEGYLEI